MSAFVTVHCDQPACRAKQLVFTPDIHAARRLLARRHGWACTPSGDRCPTHTHRSSEVPA